MNSSLSLLDSLFVCGLCLYKALCDFGFLCACLCVGCVSKRHFVCVWVVVGVFVFVYVMVWVCVCVCFGMGVGV